MNKLIVFIIIIVVALGTIGTSTAIMDSYATIALKQSQQPSENTWSYDCTAGKTIPTAIRSTWSYDCTA
jgi:hypothetical protein